jgi:hypothetical protein
MQVGPVHGDRSEPVPQSTKSHAPQQRASANIDGGHLEPSVGSGHPEHIGDSREGWPARSTTWVSITSRASSSSRSSRLGSRGGVRREARSVDCECQPRSLCLHQPAGQQVPDAAAAADPKAVDGWVRGVMEDRHVDDRPARTPSELRTGCPR